MKIALWCHRSALWLTVTRQWKNERMSTALTVTFIWFLQLVIQKMPTCPSLLGVKEQDKDKVMVWIYRECLPKQTHCQNTECFFLPVATLWLRVYYSYANLRQVLYSTAEKQWPWNASRAAKLVTPKYSFYKASILSSSIFIFSQHLFWLAVTGLALKVTALHSQWQGKHSECMFWMLPHPPVTHPEK